MSQYQRLLFVAGPYQKRSAAFERAAALARTSGAALHMVAFVEPFPTLGLLDPTVQKQVRESYLQSHHAWLEHEASALQGQGGKVTTEVVWTDDVFDEIIAHLEEMRPDLLIKDIQHVSAFRRAFVTPLDWLLLRECKVPVHLVSEARNPVPRRVVAAVDTSRPENQLNQANEQIVAAASALAMQCQAELHLLQVCDLSPAYVSDAGIGTGAWSSSLVDELRNSVQQTFNAFSDRYGVAADRRHFEIGVPVEVIANFAKREQDDVIVMGTVHRRGVSQLIGSTTEHVLHRIGSSVLAVKLMDTRA